jgi:hypothetical protein
MDQRGGCTRADTLEKRLEALEEKAKPRMISTYADFVLWLSADGDEEAEFSPEMEIFIEDTLKHIEEAA